MCAMKNIYCNVLCSHCTVYALLVWGDASLVLDLLLRVLDGVRGVDVKCDMPCLLHKVSTKICKLILVCL